MHGFRLETSSRSNVILGSRMRDERDGKAFISHAFEMDVRMSPGAQECSDSQDILPNFVN